MRRRPTDSDAVASVEIEDLEVGRADQGSDQEPGPRGSPLIFAAVLGGALVVGLFVAAWRDASDRVDPSAESSESTPPAAPSTTVPTTEALTTTLRSGSTTSTTNPGAPLPSTTIVLGDGWPAAELDTFFPQDVVELDGEWLASGFGPGGPVFMRSSNGLNWSPVSTNLPVAPVFGLAGSVAGGVDLVLHRAGSSSSIEFWHSDDGSDWELARIVPHDLQAVSDVATGPDSALIIGAKPPRFPEPIPGSREYLAEHVGVTVDTEVCSVSAGFLSSAGARGFTLHSCAGEEIAEVDRTDVPSGVIRCLTDVAQAGSSRSAIGVVTAGDEVETEHLPLFAEIGPVLVLEEGFVVSIPDRRAFGLGGPDADAPCFGVDDDSSVRFYRPGEDPVEIDPGDAARTNWIVVSSVGDTLFAVSVDDGEPELVRQAEPPYTEWVDATEWTDVGPAILFSTSDGRVVARVTRDGGLALARAGNLDAAAWVDIPSNGFPIFGSDDHAFVGQFVDGANYLVRVPLP